MAGKRVDIPSTTALRKLLKTGKVLIPKARVGYDGEAVRIYFDNKLIGIGETKVVGKLYLTTERFVYCSGDALPLKAFFSKLDHIDKSIILDRINALKAKVIAIVEVKLRRTKIAKRIL